MKPLIIEPEAEADIEAAYDWYEANRTGLGDDFLLCIEATLLAVGDRPRTFVKIYKAARRAVVRRFPHIVLFLEHRSSITVVGVFHFRRNPDEAMKRVR